MYAVRLIVLQVEFSVVGSKIGHSSRLRLVVIKFGDCRDMAKILGIPSTSWNPRAIALVFICLKTVVCLWL